MRSPRPATPRFGLVVFDLDGTLVAHDESIWATLHRRIGSNPIKRKSVVKAALAGELSYAEWVAEDIAMLREAGATRALIQAIVDDLALSLGAPELLHALAAQGTRLAILSGGLDLVAQRHLPEGIDVHVSANRLEFDVDGMLIGGVATRFDRAAKGEGIRHLADLYGVELARVAFVGNGHNDVEAAQVAGFSIAWNDAPPELRAVATVHVPGPDMRAAIDLLVG